MKRQEDEAERAARPSFRLPAPSNPARTAQRKFRSPKRRKAQFRVTAAAMPGWRTPQPGGQLQRRAGGVHGSAASAVERAGGRAAGEPDGYVVWVQGEILSTLIFSLSCRHLLIRKITQPLQNLLQLFFPCIWSKHTSGAHRQTENFTCHIAKNRGLFCTILSNILYNIVLSNQEFRRKKSCRGTQ